MILPKKKGFTLIELLIVVAIVGSLASAVYVMVSPGREKARDARRKEELRHIRILLEVYYQDHGQYPVCGDGPSGWGDAGTWECMNNALIADGLLKEVLHDSAGNDYAYDNHCFIPT